MTSNARVAVLGETTVKRLFPEGVNPLGETIQIGGVPFRVIGVLEKYSGASFGEDNNDVICIPLTTAQTRLQTERNLSGELPVSVIVMQATSTSTIDSAVEATTRFLHNQHKIKPGKEDDFIVTTTKDLIKSFDAVIGIITIFLSVIGGISLLVGGIGVMNIMMVTVTERTREIGLRKAVGARYRDIMLQFLTEATVLCFVGGALGLYIALVLILGVRAAIPDLNPTVSLRSIVLAVGVTSFIGMFFGLYPASRAASMDPIAALRSE
jgi:putative ABC transport system permease protein